MEENEPKHSFKINYEKNILSLTGDAIHIMCRFRIRTKY